MATLLFEYYSEDETTDPPTYTKIRDLSPMYVMSITTSTSLNKTVLTGPGMDPAIIPLGINERNCQINASFGGGSFPVPSTNLVDEVTDETYIQPNYVVKIKTESVSQFPTLYDNQSYWRIDKFAYDRNAVKMGKYEFTLVLNYIWTDDDESMLYDM